MTAGPRRLHKLTSWSVWIAVASGVFLLFYAIAGNLFLRSEWGQGLLNRRPERLTVTWQRASTWLPGLVQVEGLEMQGTSRRVAWRSTVDRGQGWIFLPALTWRHLWILSTTDVGAEVEMDLLPKPDTPRPELEKRGWKITLSGMDLEDLQRLRVGPYELAGPGSIAGKASFEIRGPMQLGLRKLQYQDARLLSDGGEVARAIDIDAALSTQPLVVTDPIAAMLQRASGRLALSGEVESLGFLAAYLRRVPWLQLGGSGDLDLDMALDDGDVPPGGRFSVTGPELWAEFFDFRAEGHGELMGSVTGDPDAVAIGATLNEFSLTRLSDGATLVSGEKLEARVMSDSRSVHAAPEHLAGSILMPRAQAQDVAAFGAYLPSATGVSLSGGSAELSAELSFDTLDGTGEGNMRLSGQGIRGSFGDATFASDLVVEGRMPRLDLLAGEFDVSGTELRLDRARIVRAGRARTDDWWARVRFTKGLLQMARRAEGQQPVAPEAVQVTIDSEMLDTAPVVVLMEQRLPRLRWLNRVMTVPNVHLSGNLDLVGQDASLRDLLIQGGAADQIEIRAEVDAVPKELTGAVFARYRKLSAALALDEGQRDWKLNNSREFYDREATSFLASN